MLRTAPQVHAFLSQFQSDFPDSNISIPESPTAVLVEELLQKIIIQLYPKFWAYKPFSAFLDDKFLQNQSPMSKFHFDFLEKQVSFVSLLSFFYSHHHAYCADVPADGEGLGL